MNGKSSGNKSFSVSKLESNLNELAELYGASAGEFMDLDKEFFDSSEDHKWSRLCNVYPELKTAHQGDKNNILELLAELHQRKQKKGKRTAPKEEKEIVEEKKEYSEKVNQKAWTLVKDPAFLFQFGEDLEKGMYMPGINKVRYILGEEETKRHLGVNLAAARMDQDTINFVFGGFATVKDTMVKMLFRLIGVRYVRRGYLTAAGFRYSKDIEDVDVLYLPEADLSGEKGRQMRFMRSDDGGFEFEYAYKSKETGLMETETQKVGIRTIVITTNDVTFDGALESGGWLFQTDDSGELTKKVVPEKLKDFVEKREILSEKEIEIWNCAFDLLTESNDIPGFVKIPYAPKLGDLFDLKRSESRRSPEKVCELIQKIAILRRYQKPEEYRDRADVVDLFIAMRIGKAAISETVSELTKKERDVYDTVKKLEAKNKADFIQADLEDSKKIPDGATVKQVSMVLPFPSDTCYRLAKSITEKGYFAKSKRGKENEYFIKSELTNPSEVGLTRMQSLEVPKDVLEECMRLVYGKNHLGNSEKGTKYINSNTKIVDPITGIELYLRGFSENTEMKNDKTKEAERSKTKKEEDKNGIRDKPRLTREKEEEESLETLILSFVTNASNNDDRGAMVVALVNRIAKERGHGKEEVKAEIDRMLREGKLMKPSQDEYGNEFLKVVEAREEEPGDKEDTRRKEKPTRHVNIKDDLDEDGNVEKKNQAPSEEKIKADIEDAKRSLEKLGLRKSRDKEDSNEDNEKAVSESITEILQDDPDFLRRDDEDHVFTVRSKLGEKDVEVDNATIVKVLERERGANGGVFA